MKRVRWLLFLALGIALLSGCEKRKYADIAEAIRAGAVLGENLEINGTDIPRMEVALARRILTEQQDAYFSSLQYEIRAGERKVHVSAAELGALWDLDDVLLKALCLTQYYPGANKARTFAPSLVIDESLGSRRSILLKRSRLPHKMLMQPMMRKRTASIIRNRQRGCRSMPHALPTS